MTKEKMQATAGEHINSAILRAFDTAFATNADVTIEHNGRLITVSVTVPKRSTVTHWYSKERGFAYACETGDFLQHIINFPTVDRNLIPGRYYNEAGDTITIEEVTK